MNKKYAGIICLTLALVLLMSLLSGCSDNKKFLVIVEKGNSEQISFAQTITTNDEKSVRFVDENGREQYLTGDYLTITSIKNKDQDLIIIKNNGILNLIFPKQILSSSAGQVKYLDENGKEQNLQGEITIIKIRENK